MPEKTLAQTLAKKLNTSTEDAQRILDAVGESLASHLKADGSAEIPRFGLIRAVQYRGRVILKTLIHRDISEFFSQHTKSRNKYIREYFIRGRRHKRRRGGEDETDDDGPGISASGRRR
tara:strand:+ start:61 stop:417 length:357 start_codon:yes stop_codon:yes gene_type:complete